MLTYEIHPILCDDIHYNDSQPFKVAKDYWFLFSFIKMKDWFDTHILYMLILQNSPSIITMNSYLLSIQNTPFIIVTMLTHYSRTSIGVTPISVIISYMLRKFYSKNTSVRVTFVYEVFVLRFFFFFMSFASILKGSNTFII